MWRKVHAIRCSPPCEGWVHTHETQRDHARRCYDVEVGPTLHLLQGESFIDKTTSTDESARLDVKANGLWESRFSLCFFDVKIFNPLARSCPKNSVEAYKYHESLKSLKYEQRILDVEKSYFVPLVSSCMGAQDRPQHAL